GLIYTMVGGNGSGGSGDGGYARAAQLNSPGNVHVDANGNVFIQDVTQRVRVANLSGTSETIFGVTLGSSQISTIAGGGSQFLLMSDGGPALAQNFNFGAGSATFLDANGDLLVADPGNGVVRKVDHATGTMSVAAGFAPGGTLSTYLQAPAGVAVDDAGTVYVNARNARLNKLDAAGQASVVAGTGSPVATGDGGPASAAGYWGTALAIGPDKALYIADPRGHRVRKIGTDGVINNVAGTGASGNGGDAGPAISAQFVGPYGVAFDSSGNLFVIDYDRVRFINNGSATTTKAGVSIVPGNIDSIAGKNGNGGAGDGGPALAAQFNFNNSGVTDVPNGAVVYQGGLYVADYRNSRIRRIDLATGIVTNVVGSGAPTAAGVGHPVGLAVLDGYLYWTQQDGSMLKRMKLPSAPVEVLAGDGFAGTSGDSGPSVDAELVQPQGLTVGPDGALYIADGSHRVRRIVP
ncbi:MAG TPA: hypothetical protein VMV18_11385, partial [bacterium]|nr:hypothetical protein [bacterium]